MNTVSVGHKTEEYIQNEVLLIQKAQKSAKDFAPLYDTYYLQIFKYVYKRVKMEHLVGEITSNVFSKALSKIGKFKSQGFPFSSWLYRIASNEIADHYRKKSTDKYVRVTEQQLSYLMDSTENIDEDTEKKEAILTRLLGVLKLLNSRDLELIEMRFFEQRSFKEIGEVLGMSEGNARIKTHRVVKSLKEKLE
mgnify:CR=1 FL=1